MGKKDRILAILYIALTGGHISVPELMEEFQVSSKSISRDISTVRQFLSDSRELVGNMELEYSSREKCYLLNRENGLQDREILALVKILLGCRAFTKKDMCTLMDRLSVYLSNQYKAGIVAALHDECTFYQPVKEEDPSLMEKVWRLEGCIRGGKAVRVSYCRLDGKTVGRKLYPVLTSFSEHYFYLTAFRSDVDAPKAVYYRIDRIKEMEELEENVPAETGGRYGQEKAKAYAQNMFMGESMKIRFLYTGPSVQAVLDRFPTAHVLQQDEDGAEISAMVECSRGTIMELLSQGSWIRVLSPDRLVEDMKDELQKMCGLYRNEPCR